MQYYAGPWTGSWQYQIPEDPMDALMYAEENHDLRLADISRLYQVELLCNWGALYYFLIKIKDFNQEIV